MPERKLIYADTVVEKLSELILLDDHEKKVLESFVEKCMAVDAVPVVHGRWKKSEYHGFLCCSECKDVYIDKTWFGGGKWNYCPNCGAKMDGGRNDG